MLKFNLQAYLVELNNYSHRCIVLTAFLLITPSPSPSPLSCDNFHPSSPPPLNLQLPPSVISTPITMSSVWTTKNIYQQVFKHFACLLGFSALSLICHKCSLTQNKRHPIDGKREIKKQHGRTSTAP